MHGRGAERDRHEAHSDIVLEVQAYLSIKSIYRSVIQIRHDLDRTFSSQAQLMQRLGGDMRAEWKEVERFALLLLDGALTERGTRPMYRTDVVDSPDAVFLVEGQQVAIECRYIAHPELLQFMGRRNLENNVPYEVVVPREPHLWVSSAIVDKNKNIDKYMANTGATEAWLLLHSSSYHPMLTGADADQTIKTLMMLGTHLVEHKFKRIWFAELGGGLREIIEIYGPNIRKPSFDWDEYVKKFAPSYPLNTHWFSPAVVQGAPDQGKFISVNFNDPRGTAIGLQPLDTKYRIDYSYLSTPNRNSNLTNLRYAFYDTKMVF